MQISVIRVVALCLALIFLRVESSIVQPYKTAYHFQTQKKLDEWLEVKGNKYVLREFLEFKAKQDDTLALRNIKRSKVSRLIIQKTSMFGLAHSKLQVFYSSQDYRSEGASASEWKEVNVGSSTEVVSQPQNSTKVCKFKLSSITSMSLSA
ncbi:hypothetical protein CRYUN_Cryun05aG0056600 [Craigia yunnanensis]